MNEVDALDEKAINEHIESVVQKAGTVDISFNAIGDDIVMNIPLVDIGVDDFIRLNGKKLQKTLNTNKCNIECNNLYVKERIVSSRCDCTKN